MKLNIFNNYVYRLFFRKTEQQNAASFSKKITSVIALADIAMELGDNTLGLKKYQKTIYLLNKEVKNRTVKRQIKTITKKIEKTKNSKTNEIPVLQYENWTLSKTTYIQGLQCIKRIYLNKYKDDERTDSGFIRKKIQKKGHSFEDKFRNKKFPDGINVKERLKGNTPYLQSYTNYLLKNNKTVTLFEGTIIENDVLIMVDVIDKRPDGSYDFYEIKNYSKLKQVTLNDMTLQYYVLKKRFNGKINSFNVVLSKYNGRTEIKDLKTELEKRVKDIDHNIETFKKILKARTEPDIAMGSHCKTPYTCDFMAYCRKTDKTPM